MRLWFFTYLLFFFSLQSDLIAVWSPPVDVSSTDISLGLNTTPEIAVDPYGNLTAVWIKILDSSNFIVEASTKLVGEDWQPVPDVISPVGEMADTVQIGIDQAGNATAIWSVLNTTTNKTYIRSSTKPFGGNWQAIPDILSESSSVVNQLRTPQIAIDPAGNATAIWTKIIGVDHFVDASTKPFGGNWQTTPDTLSSVGRDIPFPQIAVDPLGNVTAVWVKYVDTSNYNIEASTKPFGTNWQPIPDTISIPGGIAQFPQIAVDSNGNATAVWEKFNVSNDNIIQASTKPFGGNWQSIPDDLSLPGADSSRPQIAFDQTGNATATWRRNTGFVLIQASTKPFGGSWQSTPNTLSFPGADALSVRIAVDPSGNATVVWWRYNDEDGEGTIQASTKPFGGNWQSVPDEISVGTSSSDPQVVADAAGRATAIWVNAGVIQTSSSSAVVGNLTVSGLEPTVGSTNGGEVIIIKGDNFFIGTRVTFGGIPAEVRIVDLQTLEVITPPHVEGYVDVTVNNILGSVTLSSGFLYENGTSLPPILSIVSPSQGLPGTLLTLIGANFQPGIQVLFEDTIALNVIYLDSTTLQVIAPTHPFGLVSITLINPNGGESTTPNAFVYGNPSPLAPVVLEVIPNSGPSTGGNSVTILGLNFTGTEVYFGTTPTAFTRLDDSTIIAIAPPGTGIVDVTVITENGSGTLALAYNYFSIPIPPIPPVPPILSSPIIGKLKQEEKRFVTQTDLINIIRWKAPQNASSIVGYQVYRRWWHSQEDVSTDSAFHSFFIESKIPIGTVPFNKKILQFKDHNRRRGIAYTYYIVSIDANGNQSTPLIIHAPPFEN